MGFAQELESRELFGELRITRTGCLGACDQGVAVVVYPEGVMYGGVTAADVREIVSEHVVENRPVERLRVSSEVW